MKTTFSSCKPSESLSFFFWRQRTLNVVNDRREYSRLLRDAICGFARVRNKYTKKNAFQTRAIYWGFANWCLYLANQHGDSLIHLFSCSATLWSTYIPRVICQHGDCELRKPIWRLIRLEVFCLLGKIRCWRWVLFSSINAHQKWSLKDAIKKNITDNGSFWT